MQNRYEVSGMRYEQIQSEVNINAKDLKYLAFIVAISILPFPGFVLLIPQTSYLIPISPIFTS